jgi:hypothetical protein
MLRGQTVSRLDGLRRHAKIHPKNDPQARDIHFGRLDVPRPELHVQLEPSPTVLSSDTNPAEKTPLPKLVLVNPDAHYVAVFHGRSETLPS